jgi:hypothetical protein
MNLGDMSVQADSTLCMKTNFIQVNHKKIHNHELELNRW